jgi:DNA (cytosine-5)-methyltransferase 1
VTLLPGEIAVDNFAGGGGASTGIAWALGRDPDIAINHSAAAIAMHRANHPGSQHYCEDVWQVDPVKACAGRPVGLAWFSPDCTHFSRAKGAAPRSKKTRGLAWVVTRWAKAVRPRIIILENVEEFQGWGPLAADGRPDPKHKGRTFRAFVAKLRRYGYEVQWRALVAADFGAPTTRRRLFLVARCDGVAITWPEPTHGRGRAHAWRAAADVIDWPSPGASIFGRRRPLAEKTLRRIAAGVVRYVLGHARPPVVRGDVAALLTKHYSGVVGNPLTLPFATVTAKDHHALTTARLAPVGTDPARAQVVHAFVLKYYGAGGRDSWQPLTLPLGTVTTRDRFGVVTLHGQAHEVVDVATRMAKPLELFRAQGFADDYVLAPSLGGRPLTKTQQIELAGNSVCPPLAQALVAAQLRTRVERAA